MEMYLIGVSINCGWPRVAVEIWAILRDVSGSVEHVICKRFAIWFSGTSHLCNWRGENGYHKLQMRGSAKPTVSLKAQIRITNIWISLKFSSPDLELVWR